jgi:hypothetical protein
MNRRIMDCEERARLEKQHAESGAAFDAARQRLQSRIGVSLKNEFLSLDRTADEAWSNLQKVRKALDQHIREHRCELDGVAARTNQ